MGKVNLEKLQARLATAGYWLEYRSPLYPSGDHFLTVRAHGKASIRDIACAPSSGQDLDAQIAEVWQWIDEHEAGDR